MKLCDTIPSFYIILRFLLKPSFFHHISFVSGNILPKIIRTKKVRFFPFLQLSLQSRKKSHNPFYLIILTDK